MIIDGIEINEYTIQGMIWKRMIRMKVPIFQREETYNECLASIPITIKIALKKALREGKDKEYVQRMIYGFLSNRFWWTIGKCMKSEYIIRHPRTSEEYLKRTSFPKEKSYFQPQEELFDVRFSINRLPDKWSYVIYNIFWHGKTCKEISYELGISGERVRQIKDRALEEIRNMLNEKR